MRGFMRIHLAQGGYRDGVMGGDDSFTEDDLDAARDAMTEILMSSAGWQVDVGTDTGWIVVPKHSVGYVEFIRVDG